MNHSRRLLSLLAAACAVPVLGLGVLPAQAAPADDIRINEVVTTGSVNDSIELVNKGTSTIDISGWILKDNDNSSKYTVAAGTTLAPGAFRAFDVAGKFGLGSSDKARLYLPNGSTLVDSFTWTSHSNPSWSRCPDGTGSFGTASLTLGAANACSGSGSAWPGGSAIANADASNVFGSDVSGLFQDGNVMWAAQNSGKLWRLLPNGSGGWTPDTGNGWTSGKAMRFTGGTGTADGEGVTATGGNVYVASERNGDVSGTSRLSVLRYDVSGTSTSLTATREWNLTSDLPAVGSNAGFEAITWVPDASLTGTGFKDESTGSAYDPAAYGAHTGGVFFVGVEGTGMVYGYVLLDSGSYARIASISSGFAGVMELQWEPQTSRLWVVCDDTCSGKHKTFTVNASGAFAVAATYDRPSGMANLNNEGFSIAAAAECVGGSKPVYWADDSNTSGHALRKGTVSC